MYSTCIGLILKGYSDYEHKRKEFLNRFRKVEVPESLKSSLQPAPVVELTREEVVNMKGRKNMNGFWDKFKNNLIDRGIKVLEDTDALVHVSGHPRQAELKRMYADLALENAAIKDVLGRKL